MVCILCTIVNPSNFYGCLLDPFFRVQTMKIVAVGEILSVGYVNAPSKTICKIIHNYVYSWMLRFPIMIELY